MTRGSRLCGHKDWDDITAFVKTIAPVHASKLADAGAVARGKQLFVDGGCARLPRRRRLDGVAPVLHAGRDDNA